MINSVPILTNGSSIEPNRIIAAIDLGTNSLHMVIVRIDPSLPSFTIIDREKETVRLGDTEKKGELKPEAMARAMATLQRFLNIAKSFNVEQIIAVATSAIREAPNGREFLKRINTELNLNVDLISGQEEARRIYLGVLSALEFNQQPHIIIDIGGGSTELILGDGVEPRFLSSTKVGAVRLTSEFIKTDPISKSEFLYLQAYIRVMMERTVGELLPNLKPGEIPRLIGTSGTIETLAIITARESLGIPPNPLTGYQFTLAEIRELINRMRRLNNQERAVIPGMSDKRSEIIIAGALILQETMSLLGLELITMCERSLREGVIVDWMLTHGLIEDRLRYASSIRQRSTLKLARKYQVKLEYAEQVAALAVSLFDQTKGILHNWGEPERELLWAAAILHNCGLYISHAAYHKHTYYLIRNGELLGFNDIEIEAIANLARYHRQSPPKKKHENYQSLPKLCRQMIDQLHPLLRLAVALDRRQIGAIASVKCECATSANEFRLQLTPAYPNDDCSLELWSINYQKSAFEEQYGLKVITTLTAHS